MNPGFIKIVTAIAIGTAPAIYSVYKFLKGTPTPNVSLGSFVLWGRPNAGKTTFISRLRGLEVAKKVATTSERIYKNEPIPILQPALFMVDEIIDLPGTQDRLSAWLKYVVDKKHVFYVIDLSRINDNEYNLSVRSDLKKTIEALRNSNKEKKRINIIASHVDKSKWSHIDAANINNEIQEDPFIRKVCESLEDVTGYVYSANLMNDQSFKQLMQSIANDCQS